MSVVSDRMNEWGGRGVPGVILRQWPPRTGPPLASNAEFLGVTTTRSQLHLLVPLMPRLVPQTAFTGLANTAANIAVVHNSTLPDPACRRPHSRVWPIRQPTSPWCTTQHYPTLRAADRIHGSGQHGSQHRRGAQLNTTRPCVPQTAFTGLANTAANIAVVHNSTLPDPACRRPHSRVWPTWQPTSPWCTTQHYPTLRAADRIHGSGQHGSQHRRGAQLNTTRPRGNCQERSAWDQWCQFNDHEVTKISQSPLWGTAQRCHHHSKRSVSQGTASSQSMSPVKITLAKTPPPKSSMAQTATQKCLGPVVSVQRP
ncbi:uncharacterized protein [Branchiostoma lanceolatum]|uniref:uncharacterized protein n=1 Tax=Branchiostoma lanceolatum TaxID=7740 RepID=UPI0034556925